MDPAPDRPPRTKNEWGVLAILSFFFGVLLVAELAREFTVAKLSVPFFLASWAILLVVHELGHAAMARLAGWRVEQICIGIGRTFARITIGGVPIELRLIPISGFVLPRPTDLDRPRLKQFLIYAAGPGIELILLAAIVITTGTETLLQRSDSVSLIALQSFCVAAIWGAVFNLIPFPIRNRDGESWSDGLGMIRCWSLPDSWFAEQIQRAESSKPDPARNEPE